MSALEIAWRLRRKLSCLGDCMETYEKIASRLMMKHVYLEEIA
jgi:hypothetical protein